MYKYLAFCFIAFSLVSCSSDDGWFGSEKKIDLTGERIRILPDNLDLKNANSLQPVILPTAHFNEVWPVKGNHCNLSGPTVLGESAYVNIKLVDTIKYNEVPFASNKGNIYFLNSNGSVSAYDKNLSLLWESAGLTSSIGIFDTTALIGNIIADDNNIFVTYGNSGVVSLDINDGQVRWTTKLLSTTRARPYIFQDKILVQTVDNKTTALDYNTGKVVWVHYGVSKEANILSSSSPIVIDGTVYVNYTSKEVFALNASTGEEIWQKKINSDFSSRNLLSDLTNGRAQIFEGSNSSNIFITSSQGDLLLIDTRSGEQIFNKHLGIDNAVWSCGSHIYYTDLNGMLSAVAKEDGSISWSIDLKQYLKDSKTRVHWTAPIVINSHIFIANSTGAGFYFNLAGGGLERQIEIPQKITAQPVLANNKLYLLSNEGYIYIYSGK